MQEAGSRMQEAGSRMQEAGGRKQDAGGRKQDAGGRKQEYIYGGKGMEFTRRDLLTQIWPKLVAKWLLLT